MSSLQLPEDLTILRFCQTPRHRYAIMKHLQNHYPSTTARVNRLEKLGFLFVSSTKQWRPDKVMKMYLISSKGRAVLRGHEEAERRT